MVNKDGRWREGEKREEGWEKVGRCRGHMKKGSKVVGEVGRKDPGWIGGGKGGS